MQWGGRYRFRYRWVAGVLRPRVSITDPSDWEC
jgi:hypothetical protein